MAIWILSVVDGTLRKVRDDAFDAVPSPDGSRIAFIDGGEVWLMGANGEDARKLFGPEKGYSFERIAWSPDGRTLADTKTHRGYDEVLLESRELKGGQATVIISDPRLKNFCWAPDGHIFYARLETLKEASANVWEVAIDPATSKASSEPRRLTNWAGFSLLDLSATADGEHISFVRKNDQSDVYLAELEANGARLNAVHRLTLDDRMDWPGGWLRESHAILFFSDRGGNFDIFRQGVNDRTAEEIIAGPLEEKRAPQLSPDGSWILYLAWPNTQSDQPPPSGRLMRARVSGGAPEFVLEVKGYPGSARVLRERWLPTARGYPDFRCPSLPPKGTSCILVEVDQEQVVFSAFDPLQGKRGELARLDIEPADTFWDLSPDGSRIAFGGCEPHGGRIHILDLVSGKASYITVKAWSCLTSTGWSPDGKSLFLTNWAASGGSILRVALNGETHLVHKANGMQLERPVVSPDGGYLAYSEVATASNAWMIENP